MNSLILDEYDEQKEIYTELGFLADEMIQKRLKENEILLMSMNHRVKTKESLAGKISKKDGKYKSLSDITDILGIRIITFFADDVDAISGCVIDLFDIDWDNSVDKRAGLDPRAFGYLSVHFICSLKEDDIVKEEFRNKRFEIQIRSSLQHVWAEIEHDLGYKSEFSIPRAIRRDFSRVAGLLEVADGEFSNIRRSLKSYSKEVRDRIAEDTAQELLIDLISLDEYTQKNKKFVEFLKAVAGILNAEISYISPEVYIRQLAFLGKKNLGDLSKMLDENGPLAIKIAEKVLGVTDLDIISSNAGLRLLCQAELIGCNYSEAQIEDFYKISLTEERAKKRVRNILKLKEKIESEN